MVQLNNLFKLSHKLTVYIPSTIDINKSIDTTEYINKTASMLSEFFGGATSTEALGYWMSDSQGLVKEKSTMIFAYCQESDVDEHLASVVEWCNTMKNELKQDAIALEFDGEMYFI